MAALNPEAQFDSCNITQAYIQSQSKMTRPIYFEDVAAMDLPDHLVVKERNPL